MHLELTQVLTCPSCGPRHGLIAFVDRMEERRIVEGRLDCPTCERRHAVREGRVHLAPEDGAAVRDPGPDRPSPAGYAPEQPAAGPPGSASMAAALLGPPGGPETLLLAGDATALGPAVAELRPEAAVVTYGRPPAAVHPRVYPVVPGSPEADLPFRSESFDGVVLSGRRPALSDIACTLRSEARLVVLGPGGPLDAVAAPVSLRELAADERAWVGVRG